MARSLSTYVHYGKSQVTLLKERALADWVYSSPLLLEVTDGLQKGSMSIVETEVFTIGDNIDDDIFVIDGGGKVVFSSKSTAIGTLVTLEQGGTNFSVNGKQINTPSATFKIPCNIKIGDTQISVKKATEDLEQSDTKGGIPVLHVTAMMAVLSLLFASVFIRNDRADIVVSEGTDVPTLLASESEQPTERAQAVLDQGDFFQRVSIETVDAYTFVLKGSVTQGKQAAWHSVRQELDGVFDGYTLLNQVEVKSALEGVPAISMVFRGSTPFVLLMTGVKVPIGADLIDGWQLVGIDEEQLWVANGSDRTAITY
jgi:ribosomal protein S4